jgi:hypothetical protein
LKDRLAVVAAAACGASAIAAIESNVILPGKLLFFFTFSTSARLA